MKKLIIGIAMIMGLSSQAMAATYDVTNSGLECDASECTFIDYKTILAEQNIDLQVDDSIIYDDNLNDSYTPAAKSASNTIKGHKNNETGSQRVERLKNELSNLAKTGGAHGQRWNKILQVAENEGWGDYLTNYVLTLTDVRDNAFVAVKQFLAGEVDYFLDPALEEEITAAISKTIDFSTFADNEEAYTQGFNDGWRAAETHHGITNN